MSFSQLQYRYLKGVINFFCVDRKINVPPMYLKRIITVLFIFILQMAFSQPSCVIQTRYFSDGLSIQYIAPIPIETTAEENCGLGVEMANTSFYISLAFTSNGAPKQLEGDLVFRFENKSTLNLPPAQILLSRVKGQQVTQYTYYILEKFINQLLKNKIEAVTFTIKGGETKTIPIKPESGDVIKSGMLCLNPLL